MLFYRCLACLACVTPVAAFGVNSTPPAFFVVEHIGRQSVTDVGTKGDSAGDILTFQSPLFDAADKNSIGQSEGFCVRTVPGESWHCSWANVLQDGQIIVAGTLHDKGESILPVTGGTGHFAGYVGRMRFNARDAKGTSFNLMFEPSR